MKLVSSLTLTDIQVDEALASSTIEAYSETIENYIAGVSGGVGEVGGGGEDGGGDEGGVGVEGPSGFVGKVGPFFFPAKKYQANPTTTTAIIIQRKVIILKMSDF